MKFAIIGAGFSGLATAWYLLQSQNNRVTLFDSVGIGGGASGIAAGLLYPYGGLHAKLNRKGLEGFQATRELLDTVSGENQSPVAASTGLLRQAFTEENLDDFALSAQKYSDVHWLSAEECQQRVPGVAHQPGIFIETCLTVDTKNYLKSLAQSCQKRGAQFIFTTIPSLDVLSDYDIILITAGANLKNFPETQQITLTPLKGQILKVEWPIGLPPLPTPLSSQAYILMDPDGKTAIVGATFERDYISEEVDVNFAMKDLMPKAVNMFPALEGAKVIGCHSGIRASAPNYEPLIKQINHRCWVLTGMGSKGLLYHALYAKKLADMVIQGI